MGSNLDLDIFGPRVRIQVSGPPGPLWDPWGPWGPMGTHGTHGAHGTHGTHWTHGDPWGPWGPWDPGDLGSVDGTLVILIISCVSWGFQGLVIFWHDLLLAGALYRSTRLKVGPSANSSCNRKFDLQKWIFL